MGGAGIVGSGGIGVGGWQIYEEVNPTTHRQLSKQGLTWNPAQIPWNDSVPRDNKKFVWDKWGSCVTKLFGNVAVNHTENSSNSIEKVEPTSSSRDDHAHDTSAQKHIYFPKPTEVTDELIACALIDHRGGNNASREKIYFKAEMAVRDKDYGWVMWNGLSTTKSNNPTTHMEYRMLLFKKKSQGEGWEVDKGFGWSSPHPQQTNDGDVRNHLFVILPHGQLKHMNYQLGGYSQRRVWAAIARVDKSPKTSTKTQTDDSMEEEKHDVLSGLKIYMNEENKEGLRAEFFGSRGSLKGGDGAGYVSANKYYDSSVGWKTIKEPIDLGHTITEWYESQGDKEMKWMTCDEWAGDRREYSQNNDWDKTMREMCYS